MCVLETKCCLLWHSGTLQCINEATLLHAVVSWLFGILSSFPPQLAIALLHLFSLHPLCYSQALALNSFEFLFSSVSSQSLKCITMETDLKYVGQFITKTMCEIFRSSI